MSSEFAPSLDEKSYKVSRFCSQFYMTNSGEIARALSLRLQTATEAKWTQDNSICEPA